MSAAVERSSHWRVHLVGRLEPGRVQSGAATRLVAHVFVVDWGRIVSRMRRPDIEAVSESVVPDVLALTTTGCFSVVGHDSTRPYRDNSAWETQCQIRPLRQLE